MMNGNDQDTAANERLVITVPINQEAAIKGSSITIELEDDGPIAALMRTHTPRFIGIGQEWTLPLEYLNRLRQRSE